MLYARVLRKFFALMLYARVLRQFFAFDAIRKGFKEILGI
jgi:hypothetical protein